MTTAIALDTIRLVPLFRGLNESEARQIAEISQLKEYAPGEWIIRQGQRSQGLWVLLDGTCEVLKGTEEPSEELVQLAQLTPYQHFGEMSFFHSAPHSASVRAESAVKLLKMVRGDFEELIHEECSAAYKVAFNTLECMAERLRRMDEWVTKLMAQQEGNGKLVTPDEEPEPPQPEWIEFRQKMLSQWTT
jgi:CRP-like cAMP-binding protein